MQITDLTKKMEHYKTLSYIKINLTFGDIEIEKRNLLP